MTKNSMINKKQVREYLKEMNVSKEFHEILELKVKKLLDEAKQRAIANARRTVQSRDL